MARTPLAHGYASIRGVPHWVDFETRTRLVADRTIAREPSVSKPVSKTMCRNHVLSVSSGTLNVRG
jgi:hypothetical protein